MTENYIINIDESFEVIYIDETYKEIVEVAPVFQILNNPDFIEHINNNDIHFELPITIDNVINLQTELDNKLDIGGWYDTDQNLINLSGFNDDFYLNEIFEDKTYDYNIDGTIDTISFSGGRVITYTYDDGEIVSWTDTIKTWTVVRDGDGNITNINIT